MSWSFYAMGKPLAVIAKAEKDFSAYKCAEPEETIRQDVLAVIKLSLSAMPESSAVKIESAGSQTSITGEDGKPNGKFVNTLKIDIQPLYGFIE